MRVRSLAEARRGATAVETAVVIGLFLLLLFAVFEYGRFLMIKQLAENAAREGVRRATIATRLDTTEQIQQRVMDYLRGQALLDAGGAPLEAADIKVYRANPATGQPMTDTIGSAWIEARFGEGIAVEIDARYRPVFPSLGLLPDPVVVRVKALMRSEAN
jgi:Flp pilus assembly protein TadG